MAEENTMSEESKKTIISFIAGLLIGGLLMFIFIEPAADMKPASDDNQDQETETTNDDNSSDEEDDTDAADNNDQAADDAADDSSDEPVVTTGGDINVEDQAASSVVTLDSVEFPAKTGWIGVRDYVDGQMTGILGVARFDTAVGLTPKSISLLRPTVAGETYAVVFYSENGDKKFNLATDSQLAGVMETFKAK